MFAGEEEELRGRFTVILQSPSLLGAFQDPVPNFILATLDSVFEDACSLIGLFVTL